MVPQLQALGHATSQRPPPGFKANAIEWVDGRWAGAADPRSEGAAVSRIESGEDRGSAARTFRQSRRACSSTRAEEKGDAPFLWAKREGEWRSISWAEAARQVAALAASLKRHRAGARRPGRAGQREPARMADRRPRRSWPRAASPFRPTPPTPTRDHAHILGNSGARAVIVSNQKLAKNLHPGGAAPRASAITSSASSDIRAGQAPDWVNCPSLGGADRRRCRRRRARAATSRASARDDLACIIYTSGTGGAPRGVQQHHGAILAQSSRAAPTSSRPTSAGTTRCSCRSCPPATPTSIPAGSMFPIALGRADLLRREPREARRQHRGSAADDHGRRAAAVRDAARADHQVGRESRAACRNICSTARSRSAATSMTGRLKPWDLPMDGILSLTLRRKVRREVRRPA